MSPSVTPPLDGEEDRSLTALLRDIKQTLCVPAAEYVPAMVDAMSLLDRAIQRSYQTDQTWLAPVPPSGEGMREALEDARGYLLADEAEEREDAFNIRRDLIRKIDVALRLPPDGDSHREMT